MPKKDKKPAYFTEEQEMFKVFVYGTLKSGGDIRGLNQFGDGANIVGKTKTSYPDYEMIDLITVIEIVFSSNSELSSRVHCFRSFEVFRAV